MTENANLVALSSATVDGLVASVGNVRKEAIGAKRARILAAVGRAREAGIDKEIAERMVKNDLRPFSRVKELAINTTGTPTVLVDFSQPANQVNPYPHGHNQQPEDDGVLFIDNIAVELPSDVPLAAYKALRDSYGLVIHYAGGKKERALPLLECLESGGIYNIDAGVDNATSPGESVVPGTHYGVQPPRGLLGFTEDEKLVVRPQESQIRLELKRLPHVAADPTLTGVGAVINLRFVFRGERLADEHKRL